MFQLYLILLFLKDLQKYVEGAIPNDILFKLQIGRIRSRDSSKNQPSVGA